MALKNARNIELPMNSSNPYLNVLMIAQVVLAGWAMTTLAPKTIMDDEDLECETVKMITFRFTPE